MLLKLQELAYFGIDLAVLYAAAIFFSREAGFGQERLLALANRVMFP
jgi:hypothetical protein